MTPQLRQAIRLLQMPTTELEVELAEAVETNPLLDWDEGPALGEAASQEAGAEAPSTPEPAEAGDDWQGEEGPWEIRGSGGSFDDDDDRGSAAERMAEVDNLQDHLLWQLHLSHLSVRDCRIGAALIDALDDDGYLRTPLAEVAMDLQADLPQVSEEEILVVLHQLQRFDPIGVAARSLGECLHLQLAVLSDETPGKALALVIVDTALERLPKSGASGLAHELKKPVAEVETAIQLLRTLDPKPGAQVGELAHDTYVVPDCIVWRQRGVWRVALAGSTLPRITIHRGYEQMIQQCGDQDASYLRGHLQEARWLLKSLEARGETLLKVTQCLLREQAAFLEFGEQALRPLTLRTVAEEVGLHESTVSRAIARKYVRTPRGTLPLKAFFASGIDTDGGGEASSTAIQAMIKRLVEQENPRKPLSDAKLADLLKAAGVPVARRTVAKYREALHILSSHERVRLD